MEGILSFAKTLHMSEAHINLSIENRIATIEFFHPQSNSLPGAVLNELAEKIRAAGQNEEILLIILKSAGERAFCAGASFDELIAIETAAEGKTFFSGFANVINAMRTCPKFILGRVQGKTVGGGVGVASSCDYCFATKHASVKLSELAVGIGPFVVGPAVERKIGKSAFSELATAANEWRSADWAQSKGLFTELFDSVDEMDARIATFANNLATYNPEAMAEMKRIYWEGTENWDNLLAERAVISGTLVLSDFTRNAIRSFKSK